MVNNIAPAKTTINEQLDVIDVEENTNYTSVKSSEQLLNSVINNDDSVEEEIHNYISHEKMIVDDNDLPCVGINRNKSKETNSTENNTIENSGETVIDAIHIIRTNPIESNEIDNNFVNLNTTNEEDIDEVETSSIDSDIAEALTQIVEEYSTNNITNSQRSDDLMSVDEELLAEAVNEINEELSSGANSVNNIVLTPPLSFRDM